MAYSRGRTRQHWSHDDEVEQGVREFIEDLAEARGDEVKAVDGEIQITDHAGNTRLDITVTAIPITPEATTRHRHNQQRRRGSP